MNPKNNRYKDLEDLLFKGFLTLKVSVGSVDFVFKTINEQEYDLINLSSGVDNLSNYNYNYIIYSIYLINGVNILDKREDLRPDLLAILKEMPSIILKKISTILERLNSKLESCFTLLEPYCYEMDSKFKWTTKGNFVNETRHTGIKGTEQLGLNYAQSYWIAFNKREDLEELSDSAFSLAKFMGSFWDSKYIKKIEAKDQSRKKEELERRNSVKLKGTSQEPQYLVKPMHTAEDLVASLEKQMRGEKDDHDLIIENYEKSLREDMLRQMQELKKLKDDRKLSEGAYEEIRSISPEEMIARMARTKEKQKKSVAFEVDSETQNKFLQMSNIDNESIINETGMMSAEEYNNLVEDDLFKSVHKPLNRISEKEIDLPLRN